MTQQEQIQAFTAFINNQSEHFKKKMIKFCQRYHLSFSEDVLQDTYLKVLEKIQTVGLKAKKPKEIENYIFMSFKLNTYQNYLQQQRRMEDYNAMPEDLMDSDGYDEFKDYLTEYLIALVQYQFPNDCKAWLYKFQCPEELTYNQLKEKTGVDKPRKQILIINKWLKENLPPNLIRKLRGKE